MMEENLDKTNKIQEEIIKYTPGGMHVCYLSDPIHLEYASDGLSRMLGFTPEEFEEKTGSLYLRNIVEEDHQIFLDFVIALSKELRVDFAEYRMICKDGSIITVYDRMESKLCEDGVIRGYSSVTDITAQKKIERALREQREEYKELYQEVIKNEERFKIISHFSGMSYYEFDIKKMKYFIFENLEDILFYSKEEINRKMDEFRNSPEFVQRHGDLLFLVHEDDKPYVRAEREKLYKEKYSNLQTRLLCGDGEYHWFLIRSRVIVNENGEMMSEIGYLRNIDEMKLEIEDLEYQTTLDHMTGLMNKVAAFEKIEKILREKSDKLHAFAFFDLDNFKEVNDTFGHGFGDEVIYKVAELLKSRFRERDILARFGGDEFIVFIQNIESKEAILKRFKEFNRYFKEEMKLMKKEFKLGSSMGVAFSDEYKTVQQICEAADEALYIAKRNGKGKVCYTEKK